MGLFSAGLGFLNSGYCWTVLKENCIGRRTFRSTSYLQLKFPIHPLPPEDPIVQLKDTEDMERRDRNFLRDEQRRKDGARASINAILKKPSWRAASEPPQHILRVLPARNSSQQPATGTGTASSRSTIEEARIDTEPRMAKKHLDTPVVRPINIWFLSGHAFHNNCKDQRNELFSTSLYELDRLLERLPQKSGTSSGEQIGMIEDDISLVPAAYSAYLDVFS
ncbi:hypothetical protein K3495_g5665 [Podosphaera aphanis]|nr:hypothetical protein K3495_g5665 [Podosphaera aphanis]